METLIVGKYCARPKPASEIVAGFDILQNGLARVAHSSYDSLAEHYDYPEVLKGIDSIFNGISEEWAGSNPFQVVLLNQLLRWSSLRTATPNDQERVQKINPEFISHDSYIDTALLMTGRKNYLAEKLVEGFRKRGTFVPSPALIPLAGLMLEKDARSPYGVSFKPGQHAQALCVAQTEKYLASTANGELVRVGKNIYCNLDDLGYSDKNGRVLIINSRARL